MVATLQPNGDTLIRARRNRLILEDRLPIPVTRETRIQKQEEVENRLVLGNDGEDRDGFFLGYKIRPLEIGSRTTLTLQPQFLVQRAIEGRTDSYPLPGEPAGASPQEQGITGADMFGLEAQLESKLLGFGVNANLDMSTFNPDNIPDGTRTWGDLSRKFPLPLVGEGTLRLFGAYRYRVWNGSLGEQDIYSAYGISLEDQGKLPSWGQLSGNYFWRFGVGVPGQCVPEQQPARSLARQRHRVGQRQPAPLDRQAPAPGAAGGPGQPLLRHARGAGRAAERQPHGHGGLLRRRHEPEHPHPLRRSHLHPGPLQQALPRLHPCSRSPAAAPCGRG